VFHNFLRNMKDLKKETSKRNYSALLSRLMREQGVVKNMSNTQERRVELGIKTFYVFTKLCLIQCRQTRCFNLTTISLNFFKT